YRLRESLGETDLIENIGVAASNVSQNYISSKNLFPDLFHQRLSEDVIITSFNLNPVLLTQVFADKKIKKIKLCAEWHHYKAKWFLHQTIFALRPAQLATL